jgi:hypothetical protein
VSGLSDWCRVDGGVDLPDGLHDGGSGSVFVDAAEGAGVDGFADGDGVGVTVDNEAGEGLAGGEEIGELFDDAFAGDGEVEQEHVGLEVVEFAVEVSGGDEASDALGVGAAVEEPLVEAEQVRIVVDASDPNLHRGKLKLAGETAVKRA